jgi:ribonuclease P protein component
VRKDGLSKDQPIGRLKRRADFLRVAAARRKWAAPGLILQVCPQPQPDAEANSVGAEDPLRIGFTASRKVGNAVKRNRARRRLKAVAGEILPAMARPGFDLVLIARPATVDRPFEALRQDLVQGLKRTQMVRTDAARGKSGEESH